MEFDLLADAHDPKAAISRLAGVINTHISYLRKNHLMHQLYNPAPKKYWKMLAQTELMGEIILGAGSVGSKTAQLKINEPGKVPLHEMSRLNLEYRQFPRL